MTIRQYTKDNNILTGETEIDTLMNPALCKVCHEKLNHSSNMGVVRADSVNESYPNNGGCYTETCVVLRIFWKRFMTFIPFLIAVGYIVYVGFAVYFDPQGAIFVCIVTLFVIYLTLNKLTNNSFSKQVGCVFRRLYTCFKPRKKISIWIRR